MQVLALECLVKVYKALILFYEEMVFSKSELSTNEDLEENEINGALIAQQYEQLKQRKSIIEHGIDLYVFNHIRLRYPWDFRFAQKPNKGIVFLQEKGIIGMEAADIAHFFHIEERLDKTAIGDYLGEGKEYVKLCIDISIFVFLALIRKLCLLSSINLIFPMYHMFKQFVKHLKNSVYPVKHKKLIGLLRNLHQDILNVIQHKSFLRPPILHMFYVLQ